MRALARHRADPQGVGAGVRLLDKQNATVRRVHQRGIAARRQRCCYRTRERGQQHQHTGAPATAHSVPRPDRHRPTRSAAWRRAAAARAPRDRSIAFTRCDIIRNAILYESAPSIVMNSSDLCCCMFAYLWPPAEALLHDDRNVAPARIRCCVFYCTQSACTESSLGPPRRSCGQTIGLAMILAALSCNSQSLNASRSVTLPITIELKIWLQ